MEERLTPALRARAEEALGWLTVAVEHGPAVFANSFGAEDMVLTDLIARHGLDIEIFTLDTGRLPEATYALMAEARRRYRLELQVYAPDAAELEAFVRAHGPNAFYESVELRRRCCALRKVAPLRRALAGRGAWVTGLRRGQSPDRRGIEPRQWDVEHGLYKFSPLAAWSLEEVWAYIRALEVPYNALHDQGYPSIGCAPCTRAVSVGEDPRAGRWWWETEGPRECGLHQPPVSVRDGRAAAAPEPRP